MSADTVLGTRNTAVDRKGKILAFMDVIVKWERKRKKSLIDKRMPDSGKGWGGEEKQIGMEYSGYRKPI